MSTEQLGVQFEIFTRAVAAGNDRLARVIGPSVIQLCDQAGVPIEPELRERYGRKPGKSTRGGRAWEDMEL